MPGRAATLRRLACATLVLWVGSWALTVLDPCCEAVAGALHHHGDGDYVHAHEGRGDTAVHDHCKSSGAHHEHEALPARADLPEDVAGGAVAGRATYPCPEPSRSHSTSIGFHDPPYPSAHVYLTTSRLRL